MFPTPLKPVAVLEKEGLTPVPTLRHVMRQPRDNNARQTSYWSENITAIGIMSPHYPRTHSANRIPAPRARSSSKANSASETFVPTDFVRNGGFIEHRLDEFLEGSLEMDAGAGRTLPVRRWEDSKGAGGGLRGSDSYGSPTATCAHLQGYASTPIFSISRLFSASSPRGTFSYSAAPILG